MTTKDHQDIKNLYFFHRFTLASVARLYGVSHTRIQQVLHNGSASIISDTECLICGLEEIVNPYYIDGNDDNHNPQNVLMLCESHIRKFTHLRRKLKLQSLSSQPSIDGHTHVD